MQTEKPLNSPPPAEKPSPKPKWVDDSDESDDDDEDAAMPKEEEAGFVARLLRRIKVNSFVRLWACLDS